jgi:O-antigen/teichoic acid export membrane protein
VKDSHRRLFGEGVYGIACNGYSIVANLAISWLAIKFLGAKGYGVYVSAFVIVSGVSVVAKLGFEQGLIPPIRQALAEGRFNHIRRLVVVALTLSLAVAMCLLGAAGICRRSIDEALRAGDRLGPALMVLAPVGLALAWRGVISGYLSATDRIRDVFWLSMVGARSATLLAIGFVFLLATTGAIDREPYTYALAICAVECGALGWMFVRYHPLRIQEYAHYRENPINEDPKVVRRSIRAMLWITFPIAMHGMTGFANSALDKLMVGLLSAEIANVGVFHLAGMLAGLASLPHRILTRSFAPVASSHYHESNIEALRELYQRSALMSTVLALGIAVGLALWARVFLPFYGAFFGAGVLPLLILLVASLVTVITGPCGYALMMIGRTRMLGVNLFIALGVNVALNLVLIPKYGLPGAAYATVVASLVSNVLFAGRLYQLVRVHSLSTRVLSFLIQGMIFGGASLILCWKMHPVTGAILGSFFFGAWYLYQIDSVFGLRKMFFSWRVRGRSDDDS